MAVSILGIPEYVLHDKVYLEDSMFRNGAIFLVIDFNQKRIKGNWLPHMYYEGVVIPLGDKDNGEYPLLMDHMSKRVDIEGEFLSYLRQASIDLSEEQVKEIGQREDLDVIIAEEIMGVAEAAR